MFDDDKPEQELKAMMDHAMKVGKGKTITFDS